MKLAMLCLAASLTMGCSNLMPFTSNTLVNDRIVNIYYASVSITNDVGRTFGAGTILKNKAGQKMIVLTAAHVVQAMLERGMPLNITTAYTFGPKKMKLIKLDIAKDLALLEGLDNEKFNGPAVKLGTTTPRIGDRITVIGAPMGEDRSVVEGLLSNTQFYPDKNLYRISAPVFFGNSGGAAFNVNGELIGVAHSIAIVLGMVIVPGAAYFISLETIKKFI